MAGPNSVRRSCWCVPMLIFQVTSQSSMLIAPSLPRRLR